MKTLVSFIKESFNSKSIKYWEDEIGFDPTKVDYSKNSEALKIYNTFKDANKLSEFFDYVTSGLTEPFDSLDDYLEYIADTNIEDYEIYNGKL